MKIDLVRDDTVEQSGFDVTQMSFDMSKTAKLFHMLSSTLYSDKMGSVVRELASNAHDSHLEAGKLDVPFELTGPTYENPVFTIRDFGVGLTKEEAENTILCYLGSSKDSSDEFIGGWGIGSKSPFAYAMNYEVIVYKNGQFAHFTCWKNESGIPEKTVIDSGDTSEPNGVKMIVPVESKDVHLFYLTLQKYMEWTNYNVLLDGTIKPRECIVSKEFDKFTVKIYKNGNGEKNLVYGGFKYPIAQCVDDRYSYASDWKQLSNSIHYGYDIAFVISEPNLVSFNMNREVLEQTTKSITFIRSMIAQFKEVADKRFKAIRDLNSSWLDKSLKCDTLNELQTVIDEINDEISKGDSIFDSIFRESESNLRYNFKSPVKLLTRRGVNNYVNFRPTLEPIEDQIKVVWSTRLRPSISDRGDFFYKNDKTDYLFLKAKSEEDCIETLKNLLDFKNFDVSKLTIKELPITITPKKYSPKSKSSPVIYCTKKKKRLPFNESAMYVERDKETYNSDVERLFCTLNKNVIFLVPSDKTKENINILSEREFEEEVEEWFEEICNNYFPSKLILKLKRHIYQNDLILPTYQYIFDILDNYPHYLNRISISYSQELERLVAKKRNKDKTTKLKKDINDAIKLYNDSKVTLSLVNTYLLDTHRDHPLAKLIINYMNENKIER